MKKLDKQENVKLLNRNDYLIWFPIYKKNKNEKR
jgi:hypothetical protein